MFIFYFVYTKDQVLLTSNENKEMYVANFMISKEVDFLLGIHIWGLRSEWVKTVPAIKTNSCNWVL